MDFIGELSGVEQLLKRLNADWPGGVLFDQRPYRKSSYPRP